MQSPLVCVTGATGLVAGHCIKLLLQKGYRVRGTVRDLQQKEKFVWMNSFPKGENLQFAQVPDITKPEGFPEAFSGCDFVLHVASPVFAGGSDTAVEVAVKGTLNACEAALAAGVKRIVVTASMASICGNQRELNPAHIWTEKDWNETPGSDYSKSKVMAEKAAWDFVQKHPQLELATIHPAAVLGPCLNPTNITSTVKLFGMDLINTSKEVDGSKFGVVHAEDVAEAHIQAMIVPEAKGQRYCISSVDQWSTLRVAKVIKSHYPNIETPTHEKQETVLLDKSSDPSKVIALLGHPLRSAESSIVEMVKSFIDFGLVKDAVTTK